MRLNYAFVIYLPTDSAEEPLLLKMNDGDLKIPITKDQPKEIKSVFNELIKSLKNGPMKFQIEEVENGDIIYQIGKEYVNQLNSEIKKVYSELESYYLTSQS